MGDRRRGCRGADCGFAGRLSGLTANDNYWHLQLLDLDVQNEFVRQPIPEAAEETEEWRFTGGIQDAVVIMDAAKGVKKEPLPEPAAAAPDADMATTEDMAPAAPAEDLMLSEEVLSTFMSVPARSTVVSGTFTAARGADGRWRLVLKREP